MAYIRNDDWYIWSSGEDIHFNTNYEGPEWRAMSMSMETFDELVAIRWARMTPGERDAAFFRATQKHGIDPIADAVNQIVDEPDFWLNEDLLTINLKSAGVREEFIKRGITACDHFDCGCSLTEIAAQAGRVNQFVREARQHDIALGREPKAR